MILKTLVTGVAAAAVVAGAAGGVTSIASSMGSGASSTTAAVQPVVKGIPLPQAPAPDLQAPLLQTLNGLAGGGSFSGSKGSYIEGGLGRIEGIAADREYGKAAAKGYFPLNFAVADIDANGPTATANVTATANTGASKTEPVVFVAGPSPTGWQISKQSALALLSSAS
ncbi:hypothetical protein TUM20985_23040 [Mycobacterium antarcticum]|uniref:hypothetical protein n=1 Tax=unclassified Mycolicibacterium TaxID=2636767 RepID=UPI002394DD3E|nr:MULTISPECIES: hypothetical protein [unclassified Mycolicibacterium]BDX31757.1 hypothetical protein TUM20985_23040 [Mycolicibacterium sp. TUM20985]GLP75055.1 hypothetical protein TUM20983_21650 [Mycolicibacterium sp. TUM20983]